MVTKKRQEAARKHLQTCIPIHSLSQEEARVAIAKDVLAALDAGILHPSNTYFSASISDDMAEKPLREGLACAKRITVCAIGAVFTAYVGRWNRFTVPKDNTWSESVELSRELLTRPLQEFFSLNELSMLESGFGDSGMYMGYRKFFFLAVRQQVMPDPSSLDTITYGDTLRRVRDISLRAMMQALIAEEGQPLPANPLDLAWLKTKNGQAYVEKYRPHVEIVT